MQYSPARRLGKQFLARKSPPVSDISSRLHAQRKKGRRRHTVSIEAGCLASIDTLGAIWKYQRQFKRRELPLIMCLRQPSFRCPKTGSLTSAPRRTKRAWPRGKGQALFRPGGGRPGREDDFQYQYTVLWRIGKRKNPLRTTQPGPAAVSYSAGRDEFPFAPRVLTAQCVVGLLRT